MAILRNFPWPRIVAESAIIIASILMALWVDAWVSDRVDRKRESARLIALHADTSNTLEALITAREDASVAAESLRQIADFQPESMSDQEITEDLLASLLFGPTFYPEMRVYDDLKNSGELALLTNPELRQALSRMDAKLEQLRVAQADLITVQTLNIDTYMVDHMDLRAFYGTITGLDIPDDGPDVNFEHIADQKFQNRVLLKLDLVAWREYEHEDTESQLLAVKRFIEMELEKR